MNLTTCLRCELGFEPGDQVVPVSRFVTIGIRNEFQTEGYIHLNVSECI